MNNSNFDANQLFKRLIGHGIESLQTITQVRECKSGSFAFTEVEKEITYRFRLDGEFGFYFQQSYEGRYEFGLTEQEHGARTAGVSYGELIAAVRTVTQIPIVEGHDGSSYFWIKPTTQEKEYGSLFRSCPRQERSIEEDDFAEFLYFFLKQYYDEALNKACKSEHEEKGFRWYGDNHYSYETVLEMLDQIDRYAEMLDNDYENPLLEGLKQGFYAASFDNSYYCTSDEDRPNDEEILRQNRGGVRLRSTNGFAHACERCSSIRSSTA